MKYAIVIIVVICIIAILIPVSRHENAETPVEKETVSDAALVIETAERIGDDFSAMNDAQRVVYTAYNYESEIMNGGLCQFFDNESGECAPFVSQALNALGAEKHKALFDAFVADNEIDIESFSADDIEYELFDSFDESFYDLEMEETLETLLAAFIRENTDKI